MPRGALAKWGNEIYYGAPFAAVAKAHSQEPAAEEGGMHDWVSKGSLRSETLDQALFSPALPIGALSQIIEDDEGMHIVRVLAREDVKVTPFTEVQADIKTALQVTDKDKQRNDYIEKLREQTRVLTIFDEDFAQHEPIRTPAAPRRPTRRAGGSPTGRCALTNRHRQRAHYRRHRHRRRPSRRPRPLALWPLAV